MFAKAFGEHQRTVRRAARSATHRRTGSLVRVEPHHAATNTPCLGYSVHRDVERPEVKRGVDGGTVATSIPSLRYGRGLVELSNLALAIAGNRQEFPHQLDCVFF